MGSKSCPPTHFIRALYGTSVIWFSCQRGVACSADEPTPRSSRYGVLADATTRGVELEQRLSATAPGARNFFSVEVSLMGLFAPLQSRDASTPLAQCSRRRLRALRGRVRAEPR